jgi:rubrerythrin
MSSSEEIITILKNIMELEVNAGEFYGEVSGELNDETLNDLMRKLIKDEERHKKLVEEALELLS